MFIQNFSHFTQDFLGNKIKYMLIKAQYSSHICYGLLCCAFLFSVYMLGHIP